MASLISKLLVQLNNTGLSIKDQPLYQLIKSIIAELIALESKATTTTSTGGVTNNQLFQMMSTMDVETNEEYLFISTQGQPPIAVQNEIPGGLINSSNTVFTTAFNYQPGKLMIYLNGVRQEIVTDYTETTSTSFTMVVAPTTGDILLIDYGVLASSITGPAGIQGPVGPAGPFVFGQDGEDGDGILQLITGGGSSKIAQVVNTETGAVATGSTVITFADSIPTNTQGDQYMSLAITPTNTNSTLLIDVVAVLSDSAQPQQITAALFQDSTVNALACATQFTTIATGMTTIVFRHKMTAGTTSSTTFKVRAGPSAAATITFNGQSGGRIYGGVLASSITITEVLP